MWPSWVFFGLRAWAWVSISPMNTLYTAQSLRGRRSTLSPQLMSGNESSELLLLLLSLPLLKGQVCAWAGPVPLVYLQAEGMADGPRPKLRSCSTGSPGKNNPTGPNGSHTRASSPQTLQHIRPGRSLVLNWCFWEVESKSLSCAVIWAVLFYVTEELPRDESYSSMKNWALKGFWSVNANKVNAGLKSYSKRVLKRPTKGTDVQRVEQNRCSWRHRMIWGWGQLYIWRLWCWRKRRIQKVTEGSRTSRPKYRPGVPLLPLKLLNKMMLMARESFFIITSLFLYTTLTMCNGNVK